MLAKILAAEPPFPAYLHRHILQLWLIKHRRPPRNESERRRAVYEYLVRGSRKREGVDCVVLASDALAAWLSEPDEHVRGFGPVPRLAAIVHQFSRDLRKRYDLSVERDYCEFACYVALTLQSTMRWPESLVGDAFRDVLWSPAPGIEPGSALGVTRALLFVRRVATPLRGLDLSRPADYSQALLRVLADVDEGALPRYVLSPAQWERLAAPVPTPARRLVLTGLTHHLVVERGLVAERDLGRAEVAETVRREIPGLVARLRLPEPLRAAHGLRAARIDPIAPAHAAAREPIVTIVGPVSHGSGLGAASRATVEACGAAGVAYDVLNHVATWGRTDEAEDARERPSIRGDINVIHFNPDVLIENLAEFGLEQFEGRYNIGFFFWETSIPTLAHRLGTDLVDEVWVSSEYLRDVFRKATDKPVTVVGTPVPRIGDLTWANRAYFGIPEDRFTFAYTFDGASRFTRKNPVAAVRAFQLAFPGDEHVHFVIKTHNTQLLSSADEATYAALRRTAREDRRITIIDDSFTSNEVHGLISVCDCYVALHRSEGLGLGMAEAMKLRVPVIATGYSGNADFTTEANAWPVRYTLVPVPARDFVYDEPGQEWAEPDVEHAAQRMLEVRTSPDREARVQRAYEFVQARYDIETVGRGYRERFAAIRAGLAGAREPLRAAAGR